MSQGNNLAEAYMKGMAAKKEAALTELQTKAARLKITQTQQQMDREKLAGERMNRFHTEAANITDWGDPTQVKPLVVQGVLAGVKNIDTIAGLMDQEDFDYESGRWIAEEANTKRMRWKRGRHDRLRIFWCW